MTTPKELERARQRFSGGKYWNLGIGEQAKFTILSDDFHYYKQGEKDIYDAVARYDGAQIMVFDHTALQERALNVTNALGMGLLNGIEASGIPHFKGSTWEVLRSTKTSFAKIKYIEHLDVEELMTGKKIAGPEDAIEVKDPTDEQEALRKKRILARKGELKSDLL